MNTHLHFSTGQDIYETPQDLFDKLNDEFNFVLDAAANSSNAKCDRFIDEKEDSLTVDWADIVRQLNIERGIWCNPPYSHPLQAKFIKKAYEASLKGATVVMLLPARTDTIAFHEFILPHAEIRFIKGRLKFGGGINPAPFPSMIVIFRKKTNLLAG